ncbi:MAG: Fe-S cluster assembly ATPase SufC [Puniceicoccales bacterium]|jgi:Fe-S cluster assembly ATP-binding protein|nr:Fe-S cluster assembly ATPase SufC [Puniceicoccales bacterium]
MAGTLSLLNLSIKYGELALVEDVSLDVGAGRLCVLMGPNGAGKSSLLKAIAGHPDFLLSAGKILLNGIEINNLPPEERSRRGIFLAFQNPIDLPGVSVAQLLKGARQARLQAGETFDVISFYGELYTALGSLSMDRSWANRSVNEGFSGGERKRCELLQILLLKPSFVLLDEIDSGLDVDALVLVGEALRRLRETGTGILLVTHSRKLLEILVPDGVAVLQEGRIVRSGGPELAAEIERHGFQPFTGERHE